MNNFYILNQNQPINLPFVDQGNFPICTLVSLAHIIQSQLDIDMDYSNLLRCLPYEKIKVSVKGIDGRYAIVVKNFPEADLNDDFTLTTLKYVNFIFNPNIKCVPVTEFCYKTDDKSFLLC
jgi:hypothetical protein